MPFEPIITVKGPNLKRGSVSYRRNARKKDGRGDPHLIISIPKGIANGAIKSGDGYRLDVGSGEDAGKARLVKDDHGISAKVLRGGVTMHFGYVPMFGQDAADREEVDVRPLPNGEFEFDAPKWFRSR